MTEMQQEISEDRQCFACGYNLRGLSGDPIQCPECGEQWESICFQIPQAEIDEKLGEFSPKPVGIFSLVIIPFILGSISIFPLTIGHQSFALFWILTGLIMIGVSLWIILIFEFRKSCNKHPHWLRELLAYLIYFYLKLTCCLAWLGLLIGAFLVFMIDWKHSLLGIPAITIVIGIGYVLAKLFGIYQRHIRQRLTDLQHLTVCHAIIKDRREDLD